MMFFGFLAAAVISLASCDLIDEAKDAIDDYQDGDEAPVLTEGSDGLSAKLVYKQSGLGTYTIDVQYEVDKEGDHLLSDTICKTFIMTQVYTTKEMAKQMYESQKRDRDNNEDYDVKYDNEKTVTIDYLLYRGSEKPTTKIYLQLLYAGYQSAYDESQKQKK